MTAASKWEWSLADENNYATEDVTYACIVTPTDLEEVSTMIDLICFCLTSYATN